MTAHHLLSGPLDLSLLSVGRLVLPIQTGLSGHLVRVQIGHLVRVPSAYDLAPRPVARGFLGKHLERGQVAGQDSDSHNHNNNSPLRDWQVDSHRSPHLYNNRRSHIPHNTPSFGCHIVFHIASIRHR